MTRPTSTWQVWLALVAVLMLIVPAVGMPMPCSMVGDDAACCCGPAPAPVPSCCDSEDEDEGEPAPKDECPCLHDTDPPLAPVPVISTDSMGTVADSPVRSTVAAVVYIDATVGPTRPLPPKIPVHVSHCVFVI